MRAMWWQQQQQQFYRFLCHYTDGQSKQREGHSSERPFLSQYGTDPTCTHTALLLDYCCFMLHRQLHAHLAIIVGEQCGIFGFFRILPQDKLRNSSCREAMRRNLILQKSEPAWDRLRYACLHFKGVQSYFAALI